ncbi:tyrosine-type recombinase/integrase [Paenibacillus chondroitinus]|uniref:Tyrosine-type recombinase/integrase n=1 Tax=Paenibacillus chondroitinus TaxID=59842 RepID=A0ABU6DGQ4_9BACL|nr:MULTISPECIES: tyrosine-type recombinase/integrase [Paenibacillus]MCY9659523.1 tyrosine-type recombinase/integrase [Paenibacillus anseongense]MEB4796918.1 tyrosine-type recombinase/integrase [Paenibacillus chondroitinus]
MLDQFIEECSKKNSEATTRAYKYTLQQFENWLGLSGKNLENFESYDLQNYAFYLAGENKSENTLRKVQFVIQKYCKWANKTECINAINFKVYAKKDNRIELKIMNLHQVNYLLSSLNSSQDKRDAAIVKTLLFTGIRLMELVSLNKNDIEVTEERRLLRVKMSKGHTNIRVIPLNTEVFASLERYLEERNDNDPALFTSSRGERISARHIQHIVSKYGVSALQLRRTFINELVRSNSLNYLDVRGIVGNMTGHGIIDPTFNYIQPSSSENIVNKLDEFYKGI